MSFTIR